MREVPPASLDGLYDHLWTSWRPTRDRPHVALGMVASVDGRVTVDGRSGPLGGDADRAAFRAVRAAADAILVGAGTVRAERYGPVRLPEALRARRAERGQRPTPRLVVVTASGDLDPDTPLFGDPSTVVAAPSEAPLDGVEGRVTVWRTGTGRADLRDVLRRLGEEGDDRVVSEGGPGLNRRLHEGDLIDEVVLTVAPVLAGGAPEGIIGEAEAVTRPLELVSALRHGDELLTRYRVRRPG